MKKLLLSAFALIVASASFGQDPCMDWVNPSPISGWTDFNGMFGGAPCDDGTGCPFNEITAFEVWRSEAYSIIDFIEGGSYTFSHCNGDGAGSWIPEYTIIAPSGAVDAFGEGDGDGCSITWTASESGTYLIVINEAGSCGVAGEDVDNGYPAITCNGNAECPPAGECPDGEIADCNGNCAPADWVGDGFCDDGSFTHNGNAIFFNCEEFDNDGGDCDSSEDCTTWVSPTSTTGWTDFNGIFGGAPVSPDCPFNEITDFEVWKSEAYSMQNIVAGTCYTFSHCNGPGAGTWIPYYAIIAPSGAVDAEGLGDGNSCSISWIASEAGTYLIVINEHENCGIAGSVDNGFPAITCNAVACASISVEEVNAPSFNIFPNPNAGQFVIDYTGVNGLATIEVIELSGRIVNSNQVSVTSGSRIDMNVGSVKGMYFIRITLNNASQVHKVVVN